MKKLILVFLVLFGAGTAAAQEAAPCRAGGMAWIETLADSMGLTPTQRTQMEAIRTESCKKAALALEAAGGNREQAKPELQLIRKDARTAAMAVLTPEQREKLKTMRNSGHASKLDCAQRGASRLERMKDSLQLTAEQAAEMQRIHADACRRSQEAITAAGGNREAAKTQIKAIRSESRKKTLAVLTPEQRERWKTMQARNKPERSAEEQASALTKRMKEQLQLSDAQLPKVEALNLSLVNQRRALKEKESQGATDAELKPLRQAMMRDYKNGLETILTPEQQATLRQAMQERRSGRGKTAPVKP